MTGSRPAAFTMSIIVCMVVLKVPGGIWLPAASLVP